MGGVSSSLVNSSFQGYASAPATGVVTSSGESISADYPYASHFVNVSDARMHYIQQGAGDPILLLHGNPTWSYIWRNIIPHLSGLGTCIAPDLVGYGRSAKLTRDVSWFDHARYLEEFIDALKLRNVTLVLHDHGSGLGFHYAMRHQSNVKAIAFFEAIVKPFQWGEFSTPQFRALFQQFRTGGQSGLGWQMIVDQNFFINQLVPQAAGRPLSETEMGFYREPFPDAKSRIPIWRFARDTPIGGEPADVWNAVANYSRDLRNSRIPKLMLYATPGALLTPEHVEWCRRSFPNLTSYSLGSGLHFLQESSPHQIGRQIAAWIGSLPKTGSATVAASAPATALQAEVVQNIIDQAGHFNMLVRTGDGKDAGGITESPGRLMGFRHDHAIHPLRIASHAPTLAEPLRARNVAGDAVGRLTDRWIFMSSKSAPRPGQELQGIPYNPVQLQRFAMLDQKFAFGDGRDGFHGFGTGQTMPAGSAGSSVIATAVGTITKGFGRFAGHEEGTYVCCGTFDPFAGFAGNVMLRVVDSQKTLHRSRGISELRGKPVAEHGITYVVFRGQAVPTDAVKPNIGADGKPAGLIVEQGLRMIEMDFTLRGPRSLDSAVQIGARFGNITAKVTFDVNAPGGTVSDPIPFTSYDEFVITDESGNNVGGFTANTTDGRVFKTRIGGKQDGIRFGGTGKILGGTGVFEGISGTMTDNSVVCFVPHVSASIYLLRVEDPLGKFASRLGAA